MFAFVNPGYIKLISMGIVAVPVIVFICIGVLISKKREWRKAIAYICISTATVMAFTVLTFICMWATPELRNAFPHDPFKMMNDYWSGSAATFLFFVLGYYLLKTVKKDISIPG
ncbi:MAG TPA: hypothetical protein VIE65_11640 [Methylobacter sp.]